MSSVNPKNSGYICVPYKHDKLSIKIKDLWTSSRNIKTIHFVTITFSEDSKPYFPSSTNHYLLAKFSDNKKVLQQAQKFVNNNPSFVFSIDDEFFQRDIESDCNFVSLYYLEYDDLSDLCETGMMIAKKEKIRQGVLAHMDLFCTEPPKLTFPFGKRIVILEVSDVKSPQSIHKYCEKTRLDLSRKGILMKSFFSFSLLEKLK